VSFPAPPLADIVVGIVVSDGPKALVFESPRGALRGTLKPESFDLPAEAIALALGDLGEGYSDLAVAAGRDLLIVQGRDRPLSGYKTGRAGCSPKRPIRPVPSR